MIKIMMMIRYENDDNDYDENGDDKQNDDQI